MISWHIGAMSQAWTGEYKYKWLENFVTNIRSISINRLVQYCQREDNMPYNLSKRNIIHPKR
jgi:hypothetical protein